jgi:hypothetical protein
MSQIADDLERRFPLEEEFIDYSGQSRPFRITLKKSMADDFYVRAEDLSEHGIYEFEVYSPVYSAGALSSALGKLRRKISKGVSTRYLYVGADGKKGLTHGQMKGRISHVGIIVDGQALSFKALEEILVTFEGFKISIKIGSPAE